MSAIVCGLYIFRLLETNLFHIALFFAILALVLNLLSFIRSHQHYHDLRRSEWKMKLFETESNMEMINLSPLSNPYSYVSVPNLQENIPFIEQEFSFKQFLNGKILKLNSEFNVMMIEQKSSSKLIPTVNYVERRSIHGKDLYSDKFKTSGNVVLFLSLVVIVVEIVLCFWIWHL